MIIIPNRDTKTLTQSSRSKVLGLMWSSFNLDLQSDIGLTRVSPRLRINTSAVTNQGRAVAFKVFDRRMFAICGTRIFKNSAQNLISPFTEEVVGDVATVPTDFDPLYSDMEVFNSTLCVSTVDAIVSKVANSSGTGAWTSRATLSATTGIHKMLYFQKYNRLYYFDSDNTIKSLNSSWTEATSGDYYLSLTTTYGIFNTMASDLDNIWIGTIFINPANTLEGTRGASILRWDGIASAVYEYKIKASGVLAMCRDDNGIMHAIDTNGSLLKYSGGGFVEIDRLPLDRKLLKNATTYGYNSFIHPNGFILTKNGTFKVLVNNLVGDDGATILENVPSGVWEWSKEKGFVHTNAPTLTTLASSDITDFGQNRVSSVGALAEPNLYSESASGRSTLIAGIDYYSDASTAVSGIFVDDPLNTIQKYGYIVTPWIFSSGLKDTWHKVWLKVRRLLDSGDKIVVKYRTTEASPVEISITWVNTTSFTTSTDITGYVGYEVEGLQGTGSGKCSHITSVVDNGGSSYSATLDETYTGVTSGTAKVRLQAWTKASTFTSQTEEGASFLIDKASVRIQLKVCLQFKGDDELFEVGLVNNPNQPLT